MRLRNRLLALAASLWLAALVAAPALAALVYVDRVEETTTTTGTGTYALAGAVTGFQSFSTVGNNNTTYYAAVDATGANWEIGLGTWTTGGNLARTSILASSNAGSAVSWPAGTKTIWGDLPATAIAAFGSVNSVICGTGLTGGTITTSGTCALSTPVAATVGGTGASTTTVGDLLIGGASNTWVKLAAGSTAGQVLTSNGSAAAPSYQAVASGGWTLLCTLTTTSGTSFACASIASGYHQISCQVLGVSFNTSSVNLGLQLSSTNGSGYGTGGNISGIVALASALIAGQVDIFNGDSAVASNKIAHSSISTTTGAADYSVQSLLVATDTAAVTNNVKFTSVGGSFDAGSIVCYGVK